MDTLTLARYYCEMSLMDMELVPERGSLLASACLLLALLTKDLGGWVSPPPLLICGPLPPPSGQERQRNPVFDPVLSAPPPDSHPAVPLRLPGVRPGSGGQEAPRLPLCSPRRQASSHQEQVLAQVSEPPPPNPPLL